MSILVTGGAGYIGSHVVRLLQEKGHRVTVIDNLSSGFSGRIGAAKLVELDLAAEAATATLVELIKSESITSVIHLAARKQVGRCALLLEGHTATGGSPSRDCR